MGALVRACSDGLGSNGKQSPELEPQLTMFIVAVGWISRTTGMLQWPRLADYPVTRRAR